MIEYGHITFLYTKYMKKISLYAGALLIVLAVTVAGIGSHTPRVSAQVAAGTLTGWGWSDTIGWISFNCANGGPTGNSICGTSNYSVSEDVSGNLTGYAWSDNIGWIQFGGLTGFPNTLFGTNAQVTSSGSFRGWVQAVAAAGRTDGWDGWINLFGFSSNGSPYGLGFNTSTGLFSGYAWGSDVVGWLTLNTNGVATPCDPTKEVCQGAPTGGIASVNLSISPSSVATGTPATLSWVSVNTTSCSATSSGGDWAGSIGAATSSGSHVVGPFSTTAGSPRTYTLTCGANAQAGGGTVNSSVQLTVTANTQTPSQPGSCPAVQNATYCSGTTGSGSTVVNMCPASSSDYNGTCEFVCNTGFRQLGNTCVLNSTIQEN
jgi:hypothetical protein